MTLNDGNKEISPFAKSIDSFFPFFYLSLSLKETFCNAENHDWLQYCNRLNQKVGDLTYNITKKYKYILFCFFLYLYHL